MKTRRSSLVLCMAALLAFTAGATTPAARERRAVIAVNSANATRLRAVFDARSGARPARRAARAPSRDNAVLAPAAAPGQSPAQMFSRVRSDPPPAPGSTSGMPAGTSGKPAVAQKSLASPTVKPAVAALKTGGPVAIGGPHDARATRLGGPAVRHGGRNVTLDGNQIHRKF